MEFAMLHFLVVLAKAGEMLVSIVFAHQSSFIMYPSTECWRSMFAEFWDTSLLLDMYLPVGTTDYTISYSVYLFIGTYKRVFEQ